MKLIHKLALTAITVCSFTYANDPGHVFEFKNVQGHVLTGTAQVQDCTYKGPKGMHFNPCADLTTVGIDDTRPVEGCWTEPDGEPMAGPVTLMPEGSTLVDCRTLPGWYTDETDAQ